MAKQDLNRYLYTFLFAGGVSLISVGLVLWGIYEMVW